MVPPPSCNELDKILESYSDEIHEGLVAMANGDPLARPRLMLVANGLKNLATMRRDHREGRGRFPFDDGE